MVTKKGNKWYIVKWIDGKRKWIATGKTERAEAEMLERAMTVLRNGQKDKFVKIVTAIYGDDGDFERMGLDALISEYQHIAKSLGINISSESMRKRRNAIGRLSAWCEKYTESCRYADDLTVPIAWRFIDSLESATANTQRKVSGELSAVWEALHKRGFVSSNPWRTAKPQKDASVQKHGRAFTLEEVRRILDACRDAEWIHHTVMIGVYTGLRLGDIFNLTWDNIDFEQSVVKRLKPSKTAKHDIWVCLPLCAPLKRYLTPFRASQGKIVHNLCTADRFGEYYFTKVLKKANLETDAKTKLSFHCFRHTFATMLAQSGATEQERMRLGGWTSAKTAQIYNHDDSRERKIIESLPSV